MAQNLAARLRCLLTLLLIRWPTTEAVGLAAKVRLLQHHVQDYNSTTARHDALGGIATWSLMEIGAEGRSNFGKAAEQLRPSWHDAKLHLLCSSADECSDVESFRSPNTAWSLGDKALFLGIYFSLMAGLCTITHYWDRIPAVRSRSDAGGNPSAPPCINTSSTSSENGVNDPPETREDSGEVVHGPTPAYNAKARVLDLFEAKVKERPKSIALEAPGVSASKQLTYEALAAAITETAAALTANGVARGQIVALILDRSIGQVVAVFAVMRSGAAFLPIAHDFPLERKRFLLTESEVAAVLGMPHDTGAAELAVEANATFIGVPDDGSLGHLTVSPPLVPKELKAAPPSAQNLASDLALLIYTSGTTGSPKGIVYDHRHLTHGVHFFAEHCEMGESSVGLLKSPYIWAIVEYELFPSLVRGGRLVVASPEGHKSPPYLASSIRDHEVSVLLITPQVLDLVVDMQEAGDAGRAPLASLKHIVTVGEPLSSTLANRVVSTPGIQAKLHNFYGASESSCTIYTVPSKGIDLEIFPKVVPAGKPQPHCSVYIMARPADGEVSHEAPLRLVRRGGVGEICFGGVTAVRYWKHESLTAKKWVDTRFGRLYRTGDLGRWRSGELEIVGRTDRQVKVRGVRIEPEEVEAVLREYSSNGSGPLLSSAAVVATSDPAELVAFVSQRDGFGELTVDLLKDHCKAHLAPAYVPKYLVLLPTLPRLPNGKPNLGELQDMANKYADEEGEVVMDSLGQMKKLSRSALEEIPTIHRCYTFWMLGVLSDHFCHCALDPAANGSWQPYCSVLASRQVPPWVEILVRTTGNDQDMFGFIMIGAYQDARRGSVGGRRISLGVQDLYVGLIYLAAALPIPQCLALVLRVWPVDWQGSVNAAPTSMWNGSYMAVSNVLCVHRWYLRMMLWSRAFLALCDRCGVPAWLQILVIVAPLLVPADAAFDVCTGSTDDNFMQWWLLGSCFVYLKWQQWYIAFYVICFHCGETVKDRAKALLPKGRTWGAVAVSLSAIVGTLMAMFHYPARQLKSKLWMAPFELSVTIIQPAIFVWGMSYVPLNLAWWGNTTLGTYVFHYYFKDQVSLLIIVLSEALAFDRSGCLLLISIFSLYALFNTIVGPAFHYMLVALSRVGPILVWIPNWMCGANRDGK